MRIFIKDGLDFEAECIFNFILCLRDSGVISEESLNEIILALIESCKDEER
jgi:hypothetical protein